MAFIGWLALPESHRSYVAMIPTVAIAVVAVIGEVLGFAASALGGKVFCQIWWIARKNSGSRSSI